MMSTTSHEQRGRIALLFPEVYASAREYFKPFLTMQGDDVWAGTQFELNPIEGTFDGIVVFQSAKPLERDYRLMCPKGRTLLAVVEPPDILRLPRGFTQQFQCILSQDRRLHSKSNHLTYSGHSWFVEIPILEALNAPPPTKTKLISAITSNKAETVGHRRRLQFVKAMKEAFGDQFDWFGRGVRETATKKEGLVEYRYHLVLENGQWPHYWTEKLADAFVANCFPFYSGAPNVLEYFPSESLVAIDVDNIEGSIRRIRESIANDQFGKSQTALAEARRRVVLEYHPYETYLRWLERLPRGEYVETRIRPLSDFDFSSQERWEIRISQWWDKLARRAE